MPDKVKELEDRLDRLENRLKATFLEIEKRFEKKTEEPVFTVEDRIQEIEDLLLLLQLEITKLKEQKNVEIEFAPTGAPSINERLNKLEEAVSSKEYHPMPAAEAPPDISERLSKLEERTDYLEEKKAAKLPHDFEKRIESSITKELDEIEKRLGELEKRKHTVEASVLEDVRKILEA